MQTEDTYKKYVEPLIEPLIGRPAFLPVEKQLNFKQKIAEIAPDATDDILKNLLCDGDWQSSLVGAWLIFIKNKIEFAHDIGELLHRGLFSTEGYCYALAKFGTLKCIENLCRYLDEALPVHFIPSEEFQDTAIYALMYIDNKNKTEFSKQYLEPNGLWTKFIEAHALLKRNAQLKNPKYKGHSRWENVDVKYEYFVRSFDFMNALSTKP